MGATVFQTINLVVQLSLAFLLYAAYRSFASRQFLRHAQLMTLGWGINIASFLLIMVPSLMANGNTFLVPPVVFFDVASVVHMPIGAAALILSTLLVYRWAMNTKTTRNCVGKRLMRFTMVLWIASIAIGASIYLTMPS